VPIYEYRCPNGHVFELFQRMTDAPPDACEVCGAGPLERVLYPVAVHFKGSGFYTTDYGRGSRKPTKEADSAATSTEGGDKAKGGDKPAEKKAAEA
jgi:putative FmdB family regulatory protein